MNVTVSRHGFIILCINIHGRSNQIKLASNTFLKIHFSAHHIIKSEAFL